MNNNVHYFPQKVAGVVNITSTLNTHQTFSIGTEGLTSCIAVFIHVKIHNDDSHERKTTGQMLYFSHSDTPRHLEAFFQELINDLKERQIQMSRCNASLYSVGAVNYQYIDRDGAIQNPGKEISAEYQACVDRLRRFIPCNVCLAFHGALPQHQSSYATLHIHRDKCQLDTNKNSFSATSDETKRILNAMWYITPSCEVPWWVIKHPLSVDTTTLQYTLDVPRVKRGMFLRVTSKESMNKYSTTPSIEPAEFYSHMKDTQGVCVLLMNTLDRTYREHKAMLWNTFMAFSCEPSLDSDDVKRSIMGFMYASQLLENDDERAREISLLLIQTHVFNNTHWKRLGNLSVYLSIMRDLEADFVFSSVSYLTPILIWMEECLVIHSGIQTLFSVGEIIEKHHNKHQKPLLPSLSDNMLRNNCPTLRKCISDGLVTFMTDMVIRDTAKQ